MTTRHQAGFFLVAYILLPLYYRKECIMQPRFKFKLDELLATPRPPFIPYEIKQYEPFDREIGDKLPSTEQPRSTSLPKETMPTDN
jgi:hypothetical protein